MDMGTLLVGAGSVVLSLGLFQVLQGGMYWRARKQAALLGLEATWMGRLVGRRGGFRVDYGRVGTRRDAVVSEVHVELGQLLPKSATMKAHGGLALNAAMLDAVVGSTASDWGDWAGEPDLQLLFADPAVQRAIRAQLAQGGELLVEPSTLTSTEGESPSEDVLAVIDRAVAIAAAIDAVWSGRWSALCAGDLVDASDKKWRRLAGAIHGVEVRVEQPRIGGRRLEVLAALRRPLPEGTVIAAHGSGPNALEADPILGGMVHAQTPEPAALVARLCRDTVRGALLEVVHGYPGSSVHADRVQLWVDEGAVDPGPALNRVLALEQALFQAG